MTTTTKQLANLELALTEAQVKKLTLAQARARRAAMTAAAKRGNFEWSYDEKCWLDARIPEERAAVDAAMKRHVAKARARRCRLGL
jgi:hypothetical protein